MNEHQPALGLEVPGMGMGVVESLAVEHDGRAMALGLGDFDRRRADRHDDGDGNAEAAAMIGDRLRMIAGRGRDHAAAALVVAQR